MSFIIACAPAQTVQEPVGCTEEAKLCPDGSAVGRVPPDCEFAPCPEEGAVYCTADVKECPDGSYVSRQPPDCAFKPCPTDAGSTDDGQIAPGETESKESCAAKGGQWQRRFAGWFCNYPADDAGKLCKDGAQCEGECLVEDPNAMVGACSEFKVVFGCVNPMTRGQITPMCID